MSQMYEELDFRPTPLGDLMLRRRRMIQLGDVDIYEIKLGDYFLMSSLFHEAETQLATRALGVLERPAASGPALDVVVGGLGLGYTAASALQDRRVASLLVVELLEGVIDWHEAGLVPLGETLTGDDRCRLLHGDFFALSRDVASSFDPARPRARHDAILLDIDHSPTNVLTQSNARFYTLEGLGELSQHLVSDGVFGLWADSAPEPWFSGRLGEVFSTVQAHTIEFDNPILGGTSEGAVYVARP